MTKFVNAAAGFLIPAACVMSIGVSIWGCIVLSN